MAADASTAPPDGKAARSGSGRIGEVDALRGLAALAVVLYHYLDRFDELHHHSTAPLFYLPWGARGVQIFFVISGFVIFMTLQRAQRPMDFVVSRFSRLYPAYWAAILLTTAVLILLDVDFYRIPMSEVLDNFTMLQRLSVIHAHEVDGVYWTLYVELWFYAAMLALFSLGLLRHVEAYLVGSLALSWTWWAGQHFGGAGFWGWNLTETFNLVLEEIPFFVLGICLYRLHIGERGPAALAIMLAALVTIIVLHKLGFLVAALVALAAFGLILSGRAGFLRHPVLVWLGAISYSVYLVHDYAGRALMLRLEEAGWTANQAVAAAVAATLVVATLFTWFIERPALRLIRRAYTALQRPRRLPGGPAVSGAA